MAQEYATGAVWIFVKLPPNITGLPISGGTVPAGGSVQLLGTSEQGPARQTDRSWKQVMNDLSSQRAFDYVYAGGEEAVLSFVLTRWNENVAQALECAPVSGGMGYKTILDVGSLMGQEKLALEISYTFTFGGLAPRGSMAGQEGGRHYVQALFWGPDQDETGTHERKKHMVFKAWSKYDPTQNPPRFTLFDFNVPTGPLN
jgi:hypothetical protein